MAYYRFNIGKQASIAWWEKNLAEGIITTGFDDKPGLGEKTLLDLEEGDVLIAYASNYGFVGVGNVLGEDTYREHATAPWPRLSSHRHQRGVIWRYAIRDFGLAVSPSASEAVGVRFPGSTKVQVYDVKAAERLIRLIRASAVSGEELSRFVRGKPKYWHVAEAVRALGRPSTIREIVEWLGVHYPDENHSDARDNACLLTVNDANRVHHDRGRRDFRSDQGNPKDALFREGRFQLVTFVPYDPVRHGIWSIEQEEGRKATAVKMEVSEAQQAMAEARREVASGSEDPVDSDYDGRVKALRTVAVREGQPGFRADLIAIYEGHCAVTGCAVVEILEAAHIKPYRGAHSNRVDNGLLLRADIHTLFDKGLLWVDADGCVRVSKQISESEYGELSGKALRLPSNVAHHPHPSHLADHRAFAMDNGGGAKMR